MINILYLFESIIFIYFSWLCGYLFFKLLNFSFKSKVKRITYPIMLGYGIVGNIGLILALFGIFKIQYFISLIILTILLSRKKILEHLKLLTSIKAPHVKSYFLNRFRNFTIIKIIIIVWVIFYATIAFMPWTFGSDGLAYHIPFAMETINSGNIQFPVHNSINYGHLPLFTEILYGVTILIFKNIIVLKIIQFSALLLLFSLLLNFIKPYVKNKTFYFLFISLLLSNTPLIYSGLLAGLVDIFVFLFGMASSLIILKAMLSKKLTIQNLIIAGIFLGIALSAKYLALFFALVNFILILYYYTSKKTDFKNIFKKLSLFSLAVIIFGGFWYIKNLLYTGNPLFPIFTKDADMGQAIEHFILERNIYNFLIFPFSFWGLKSILKLPYAFLNAIYFASTYAMGLFLIFKKNICKVEILLLVFTQLYLLPLFFFSHQFRFAIPALITTNMIFILFSEKIINLLFKKYIYKEKFHKIIYYLTGIISIVLLFASVHSFEKKISCLESREDRISCTARSAGSIIYAVDYINKNIKSENIIQYWSPHYNYNLKNNNLFLNNFCIDKMTKNNSSDTIVSCLNNSGIKYLLNDTINVQSSEKYPDINMAKEKIAVIDYFIENGNMIFEKFYEPHNTYIRLYKLK